MVVGLLDNESPDSNRLTLVTPKSENDVRLQATLGNQNPTGLPWEQSVCGLQGDAFELSIQLTSTSSEIFMRRFMNSKVVKMIDNGSILQMNIQPKEIIERVEEEYKKSNYGSVKYTKNEMYWIGYLYRYFSYTYELSSTRVYKIVKPKELRGLFLPYHTLSPEQAIERILEAKGMFLNKEDEINRQFEIYKRIRGNH